VVGEKSMTDLTLDPEKIMALEQAGLLKGRYYIVLEPNDDEDEDTDGFSIRAYATRPTHNEVEGESLVDPTYVILQGLLGAVHENFEDLYEMGLERVTLEALGQIVPEEELKPAHRERIKNMEGNVITADFGSVQ
jgi:hypothetical protein